MNDETTISRTAAPEDITPGCFVAIHSVIAEFLPEWCLFDRWSESQPKTLRVAFLPCGCANCMSTASMKVKAVCLPFVFVKTPTGSLRTLDVRRYRLSILPQSYGEKVYKKLKPKALPKATPTKRLGEN